MSSSEQQAQGQASAPNLVLLQQVKHYAIYLLKWSWLIVACGLAMGYWLYQRKLSQPTYYIANLTFMMNEDKATQQGLLSSILGFSGGLVEDNASLSTNKIEELLHTRKLLQIALFTEVELETDYERPRKDYLINHFLYYFWHNSNPETLKDTAKHFYFKRDTTPAAERRFSRREGSVLLSIYNQIKNDQLSRFHSPANIITISYQCTKEEFAVVFTETLYKCLNDYYTQKTIEKQENLYKATCERRDTLDLKLRQVQSSYSGYLDGRNASAVNEVKVATYVKQKELMTVMETYFMAVKNAEAAGYALEQQMPVMQMIDSPMYPLPASRPNPVLHGILGLLVGMFLPTAVLLGWKLWQEVFKVKFLG